MRQQVADRRSWGTTGSSRSRRPRCTLSSATMEVSSLVTDAHANGRSTRPVQCHQAGGGRDRHSGRPHWPAHDLIQRARHHLLPPLRSSDAPLRCRTCTSRAISAISARVMSDRMHLLYPIVAPRISGLGAAAHHLVNRARSSEDRQPASTPEIVNVKVPRDGWSRMARSSPASASASEAVFLQGDCGFTCLRP